MADTQNTPARDDSSAATNEKNTNSKDSAAAQKPEASKEEQRSGGNSEGSGGKKKSVTAMVSYLAVLARAEAYSIRAARTRSAVERLHARYLERADSAQYLKEGMTALDVDEPTTAAYMEVSTLSHAMADNVAGVVSASDALSTIAQSLEEVAKSQHSRMADANRTHNVQMADRRFIQRR